MKNKFLNYYLYISWDNKNQTDEFLSYMMVARTMIKQELGSEMQNLGDNAFVFSSAKSFQELKDKLKHKRFPYVLLDITMSISLGLLSTYLQDGEMEVLNKFVDKSIKKQINYFNSKLEECLEFEDFENACLFRDLINNKFVDVNA